MSPELTELRSQVAGFPRVSGDEPACYVINIAE